MKPLDPVSFELTIEQQFKLQSIKNDIEKASREQLQEMMIDLTKMLMVKDNVIRSLLMSDKV